MSVINIKGKETSDEPKWKLNKTTATYGSAVEKLITINDDYTLALDTGVTLSVSRAAGYVTEGKTYYTKGTATGYKLTLGSSLPKPETKSATWNLSGSTATLATVKGAKSKVGLSVSGDNGQSKFGYNHGSRLECFNQLRRR